MSTVPLVGRELCFWCIEAFDGCHLHGEDDSSVFWNHTSIGSFHDDEFLMVDEHQLINVQTDVEYSNNTFRLPTTASFTPVSRLFHFESRLENAQYSEQVEPIIAPKPEVDVKIVAPKRKYTKRVTKVEEKEPSQPAKKPKYTKIHKNAIKTVVNPYLRGKKCDQSLKVFVCDICEMSFTLRHNTQAHLILFHGDNENVSEEKKATLKSVSNQIDRLAAQRLKREKAEL